MTENEDVITCMSTVLSEIKGINHKDEDYKQEYVHELVNKFGAETVVKSFDLLSEMYKKIV